MLSAARAALASPAAGYDGKHGFYNPDLVIGNRSANGSSATSDARLTLAFGTARRASKRLLVRYQTRPRITGRLATANGKPIVGARVWRAERVQGAAWKITGKALVTSRTGRVSGSLLARNPNRAVRLVYFPHTDTNDYAGSPNRDLRVRATSTIQTDQGGYRNGDTVKFSGQLIRKGLINSKSIELQAMVDGRWQTFKTTHADRSGRWKTSRTLRFTRRPTLYSFRALVTSRENSWPWSTGYSRSIRVLVTP